MYNLIVDFAEQAFLSYNLGMYQSSISCSVNCCEYILKYELLRKSSMEDQEKYSKLNLGSFTGKNNGNLKKLRILKKFSDKINYLNKIRNALNHYSPDSIEGLKKKGETRIEKHVNPILNELMSPVTAYKAYSIMKEILDYFYNEKNRKKFIQEGLKDAKIKMKKIGSKIHQNQYEGLPPVSKELIEGYMEKKYEYISKEMKKK